MNQSSESPQSTDSYRSFTQRPFMARIGRQLCLKAFTKLTQGQLHIFDRGERLQFGSHNPTTIQGTIHIESDDAWAQLAFGGSLGFAEAYMSKDWETPNLTNVIRVLALNIDELNQAEDAWYASLLTPTQRLYHFLNRNTEKNSKRNIAAHYDIGNELFALFLDPLMMYSSAIYQSTSTLLDQAAAFKCHRIAKKLDLQPNDHLLEIGTGWGSMAIIAARDYGCQVTTTTLSEEQFQYTQKRIQEEGLSDKITLLLQDYRLLHGSFDKVVSIEMIEAVGNQFYDTYFHKISTLLKKDGLALIQGILLPDNRYKRALKRVDFIQKYIFPGSCIPSQIAMQSSISKTDLSLLHYEDIGQHYARTLADWHKAFNQKEAKIIQLGYNNTFIRMWRYYFSYCEGGFAERAISCGQFLYAKPGNRHSMSETLFEHYIQDQTL